MLESGKNQSDQEQISGERIYDTVTQWNTMLGENNEVMAFVDTWMIHRKYHAE